MRYSTQMALPLTLMALKKRHIPPNNSDMTHQKFDALIGRLETYAQKEPNRYKVRVALLACLGYAYLFFVLACLLAMLGIVAGTIILGKGNIMFLKLAIAPAVAASIILRSLKVSLTVPQGVTLDRASSPELFALLDETRAKLKATAFHQVLLNDDFNAAVAQIPRLGMFGWQRNFLILGLPLMQALTPEQFQAVLAHEAGHLSGNHGQFGGWIHRIRLTWVQVLENLHANKQRRAAAWLRRFFDWYAPYFSAYSFVLARGNEYQADRCAAEVAGVTAAAQALVTMELRGRFLQEKFWPEVFRQVEHQAQPPLALTALKNAFQMQFALDEAQTYFHRALDAKTGTADTHPSLTDRLKTLGYAANAEQALEEVLAQTGKHSAAERYFGPALPQLQAKIEAAWTQQVTQGWEKRHGEIREGRRQLAALMEKAQSEPLTEEESWQMACSTAEFGETETAKALFQEIVTAKPEHAAAQRTLGLLLLHQDDPQGLVHLETAMTADPRLLLECCQAAFDFCQRQGRSEEAEEFRKRAEDHRALLIRARTEREEVGSYAQFEAHDLSPSVVEELSGQLRQCHEAKSAYLVRKKVQHLPEHPLYVLWIVPGFITKTSHQDIAHRVAKQIQFPGQMHVMVAEGSDLRVLKIRRTLKNALIYKR